MNLLKQLIPDQHSGAKTGATSTLNFKNKFIAIKSFNTAKYRLLDVNHWFNLCGRKGAEFQLTDESGNALQTTIPEVGNLIRIKLPAPPNPKGDGYDWVRIEKFENLKNTAKDEDLYGFRVRPVSNPFNRSGDSAHFYTSEATSSFLIYRKGCVVSALERGRNEKPNTSGSLLNKLRNFFVALPAMLGLSKPQWKNLVDGILGSKQI